MTYRYFVPFLIVLINLITLEAKAQAEKEFVGIRVALDQHNQVFYKHTLKPKETLYGLSRYFKIPLEDLALVNNISPDDILSIGTDITIPINTDEIFTTPSKEVDTWIPLIYKVDKQETLYKISNSYFPQKIENLISRNNINSFSIKEGRLIVVGWWSQQKKLTSITDIMKDKKEGPKKNDIVVKEEPSPTTKSEGTKSIIDLMRERLMKKTDNNQNNRQNTNPSDPTNKEENTVIVDNKRPNDSQKKTDPDTESQGNHNSDHDRSQDASSRNDAKRPSDIVNTEKQETQQSGRNNDGYNDGYNDEDNDNDDNNGYEGQYAEDLNAQDQMTEELVKEISIIDTTEAIPEPPRKINYRSGIAIWDKEGMDRTNLFVMHNEAKVDSYIRLRYGVTGQEVTAKVICAIPSGLYPRDTSIILSPAVARALGAKDSRFQIRMDYY